MGKPSLLLPTRLRRQTVRAIAIVLAFFLGGLLFVGVSQARSPLPSSQVEIAQSAPAVQEETARSHYDAGRFDDAATDFAAAAASYARQGDDLAEAASLTYQAMALYELGRTEDAQTVLDSALTSLQTLPAEGRQAVEAQATLARGRLQLSSGQPQAALETWQQAATLYASLDDPLGELGALNNQAIALQSLGLYRRSQTLLESLAARLEDVDDPRLYVAALTDLGIARQVVGNLEDSQRLLQLALERSRSLDLPEQSVILRALGDTTRALGDLDAAISFYQQAADIAPTPLDAITAQLEQARTAVQNQQRSDAHALLNDLEPQLASLPPSRRSIYAIVHFANTRLQLTVSHPPHLPSLAQLLALGIERSQTLGDSRAQAYALTELARLYEREQQLDTAIDLTQQALSTVAALNAPDITARAAAQLGRLYETQGEKPQAIAAYSSAVKALQAQAQDLVAINPEVRLSFRDSIEPVYRSLVSLLLAGTPSQDNLKQARETIEALQVAELDNFFREACLDAQPQEIDGVDRTAAAIYPIVLSDRLEVILSLPGRPLRSYRTALTADQLQDTLDRFRQSLSLSFSRSEQLALYSQLYDWLVRPAEADLADANIQTLVFVLDSGLRNLPMSVLYDGDRYLIEKYNLALAPSLKLLEPRPLDNTRLQAVVGGLSEARQGFTALPGVESEIDRIASAISTADVRLNQEFTTEATRSALQKTDSPVLHLATHGQFSSNADDTFILTWDGTLNVSELGQLLQRRDERQAGALELLVLSACQTAFGDDRATLGLAGLAVKSGARATVATLWAVRDSSTANFMVEFYRQLAVEGTSKAKALREAQLYLLRQPEYSRPFYWAPFVLIGNWL